MPITFWNPSHQGCSVRKKDLGEANRSWRWNYHEWNQNIYKEKGEDRRRWPSANQETGTYWMSIRFSGALIMDIPASRVVRDEFLLFNPLQLWYFVITAQSKMRSCYFNSKISASSWSLLQCDRGWCRDLVRSYVILAWSWCNPDRILMWFGVILLGFLRELDKNLKFCCELGLILVWLGCNPVMILKWISAIWLTFLLNIWSSYTA